MSPLDRLLLAIFGAPGIRGGYQPDPPAGVSREQCAPPANAPPWLQAGGKRGKP